MTRFIGSLISYLGTLALLAGCVSLGPAGSSPPLSSASPSGSLATPSSSATLSVTPTAQQTATAVIPTGAPTAAPTDAPTGAPTDAPTGAPTDAPTEAPTDAPTDAPTGEPGGTLDFTKDPNYGAVELASGFVPDPHTVNATAGGDVDVGYLENSDCVGYATSAPDYEVEYTAGTAGLLRFYFVANEGGGDATMIINDPSGTWHCDDDSYDTTNPTIDFSSPSSGKYDIWVAQYFDTDNIPGTLHVTELDSNHP